MSLSGSLANAISGLTASARGAQVVSSNVSNALTEGYGPRVLETGARSVSNYGIGVQVLGVRRDTDLGLLSDRRLSEANTGQARTRSEALGGIEAAFGTPDRGDSISARLAALEAALVTAASRPDGETRLAGVLSAAQAVAGSLSDASGGIQALRMEAETAIMRDVETLNDSLARVADLNTRILRQVASGNDPGALLDQRQVLVDQLAEIVPLRQIERANGTIALYTQKGAMLVDARPAEFGFAAAGMIVPDMTFDSGALSGLTLNGEPVATTGSYAPMGGGRLGALFEQRDVLAVEAQADLDALARDLVERFADPGLDPTLAAGAAGLFTDRGAALDPALEVGLAGRVAVNAAVDPAQGGALWRLRSGLGAATPGNAGDSTLLNAFAGALSATRPPSSGPLAGQAYAAAELASETLSRLSVRAQRAVQEESFASSRTEALRAAELAQGVDTDAELQNLMLFEKAYAANAKVIEAVDQMLGWLMEI